MNRMLGWCSVCKEKSAVVKIKNGKRTEICLNRGHGFMQYLPKLKRERAR